MPEGEDKVIRMGTYGQEANTDEEREALVPEAEVSNTEGGWNCTGWRRCKAIHQSSWSGCAGLGPWQYSRATGCSRGPGHLLLGQRWSLPPVMKDVKTLSPLSTELFDECKTGCVQIHFLHRGRAGFHWKGKGTHARTHARFRGQGTMVIFGWICWLLYLGRRRKLTLSSFNFVLRGCWPIIYSLIWKTRAKLLASPSDRKQKPFVGHDVLLMKLRQGFWHDWWWGTVALNLGCPSLWWKGNGGDVSVLRYTECSQPIPGEGPQMWAHQKVSLGQPGESLSFLHTTEVSSVSFRLWPSISRAMLSSQHGTRYLQMHPSGACMVAHWEGTFVLGLVDILHIWSHSQDATLSGMSLSWWETEVQACGSKT